MWPWITLALLGAYHGINPGMGWLFAVGLGLQERSRRAVLRALGPIALGHELGIVLVAGLVIGLEVLADATVLRLVAAGVLIAFGLFRFARPRAHPRWTTMRVNRRELTLWSFLMSTAHGAGLMVAPVLIGLQGVHDAADPGRDDVVRFGLGPAVMARDALGVFLHVGAMLIVMGVVAVVVYEKVGLGFLRRAWINLDHLWAGAFVVAGIVTLMTV
jgi:hypothetical protein